MNNLNLEQIEEEENKEKTLDDLQLEKSELENQIKKHIFNLNL